MHPVVVGNTRDGVTVRSQSARHGLRHAKSNRMMATHCRVHLQRHVPAAAGKEDTEPIDEAVKVASSGDDILLLADELDVRSFAAPGFHFAVAMTSYCLQISWM